MDPDALLINLRAAVAAFIHNDDFEVVDDIVYMFDNLDHWLTNGGFIPTDWMGREPRHTANA